MSDSRLRITIDEAYVHALGLATYAFARCEWQVVWCCEKIKPGVIQKIVDDKKTAGSIGKFFFDLVRNMPRSKGREELAAEATNFLRLVELRNKIFHGKPCTASDGEQRLSSDEIIDMSDLEQAADAFADCGNALNGLFYGFLDEYVRHLRDDVAAQ